MLGALLSIADMITYYISLIVQFFNTGHDSAARATIFIDQPDLAVPTAAGVRAKPKEAVGCRLPRDADRAQLLEARVRRVQGDDGGQEGSSFALRPADEYGGVEGHRARFWVNRRERPSGGDPRQLPDEDWSCAL